MSDTHPLLPAIYAALGTVIDPELGHPITDLGMVGPIEVDENSSVSVTILLTTPACPLKARFTAEVTKAVGALNGVSDVQVIMSTMDDEQRGALRARLKVGQSEIPFARPDSPTRVISIASGKGGVGKSSLTVNLGCALAALGHNVGIIDADIYGHSIPDLLGIGQDEGPVAVEGMDMILPVEIHGLKVMSIGMMKPSRDQVVAWRGPVVDRAIAQFLTDVFWSELDFLLIDLPPGTGDTAIGLGQKLPTSEVIVVTTPQLAATEVAERAGTMASMLNQKVIGVVENMSYIETECPECGHSHRQEIFGSGGGSRVASSLADRLGYDVPLMAQIPLEPDLRAAGDKGIPWVLGDHTTPAATALRALAESLAPKKPSLKGVRLNLDPLA